MRRTEQQEAAYQQAMRAASEAVTGATAKPGRQPWPAGWVRELREEWPTVLGLLALDGHLLVWAMHQVARV